METLQGPAIGGIKTEIRIENVPGTVYTTGDETSLLGHTTCIDRVSEMPEQNGGHWNIEEIKLINRCFPENSYLKNTDPRYVTSVFTGTRYHWDISQNACIGCFVDGNVHHFFTFSDGMAVPIVVPFSVSVYATVCIHRTTEWRKTYTMIVPPKALDAGLFEWNNSIFFCGRVFTKEKGLELIKNILALDVRGNMKQIMDILYPHMTYAEDSSRPIIPRLVLDRLLAVMKAMVAEQAA